jgi:hypothetical protein
MDTVKLWLRDEVFEHGILHPSSGDPKKTSYAVMAPLLVELRGACVHGGYESPSPKSSSSQATSNGSIRCAAAGGGAHFVAAYLSQRASALCRGPLLTCWHLVFRCSLSFWLERAVSVLKWSPDESRM